MGDTFFAFGGVVASFSFSSWKYKMSDNVFITSSMMAGKDMYTDFWRSISDVKIKNKHDKPGTVENAGNIKMNML